MGLLNISAKTPNKILSAYPTNITGSSKCRKIVKMRIGLLRPLVLITSTKFSGKHNEIHKYCFLKRWCARQYSENPLKNFTPQPMPCKRKSPQIVYWNPLRNRFHGRLGNLLPIKRRVNNFGDLIGPLVVEAILQKNGVVPARAVPLDQATRAQKLLSVGSILHFARSNDVIWGAGRNGKISSDQHKFDNLDVRMVRGPLTREFLKDRGVDAPETYGDPALLLPALFKGRVDLKKKNKGQILIIPNLHDTFERPKGTKVISPCQPIWKIVNEIVKSDLVLSSSLHGFILSEAFGIDTRLLKSTAEPSFKYQDYAMGTDRDFIPSFANVKDAMSAPPHQTLNFCPERMLSSFPFDMFPTSVTRPEDLT